MLKPYNDPICLIRQQQQQPATSLKAAFDHALQQQLEEEIKKEGESKNESPDT